MEERVERSTMASPARVDRYCASLMNCVKRRSCRYCPGRLHTLLGIPSALRVLGRGARRVAVDA
jgi:hypothetical protein